MMLTVTFGGQCKLQARSVIKKREDTLSPSRGECDSECLGGLVV